MKNSKYHMNIGAASLILLIAVFALTVFAVLSIRASYGEKQMAERGREAVENYYRADETAEEFYAAVVCAWKEAADEKRAEAKAIREIAKLPENVATTADGEYITGYILVDYNRTLEVVLHLTKEACSITAWRLVSGASGNYEEEIEIWDGVFTK